jgi:hypothetical protein
MTGSSSSGSSSNSSSGSKRCAAVKERDLSVGIA